MSNPNRIDMEEARRIVESGGLTDDMYFELVEKYNEVLNHLGTPGIYTVTKGDVTQRIVIVPEDAVSELRELHPEAYITFYCAALGIDKKAYIQALAEESQTNEEED